MRKVILFVLVEERVKVALEEWMVWNLVVVASLENIDSYRLCGHWPLACCVLVHWILLDRSIDLEELINCD